MAGHAGICINFGLCETANRHQSMIAQPGEPFTCPECGQPLQPLGPSQTKFPWKPAIAAAVLAVVALIIHWLMPPSGGQNDVHAAVSQGTVILRLSGANRIGSELAPALAEEFLKQRGAKHIQTVPGNKAAEVQVQGTFPGDSNPRAIEIRAHGTDSAFQDLESGICDIAMASRKIKPREAAELAKAGVGDMSSPASEHVLGIDAIAVIISKKNPIESLNKKQLSLIFTGEVTNWRQVGGGSGPINVYVRDESSGTFDTFKSLVLGSDKNLPASAHRITQNRELSDKVANDPNGIGVISLENIRDAKAVAISENGARPLLPDELNVATEDYPLTRRLTLFTASQPKNDLARKFVDFALSREGQQIVAKLGFVGQNVSSNKVSVPGAAPEEYRKLTAGADRLSLDFRFQSGNTNLDGKSLADVDRVATFLSDLHYTGNNVLLFGFADNTGSRQVNDELSKERADAVAREFQQRGIRPAEVTGFGSQLPVASNDTPEGRLKNRRVEIWLKK